MPRRSHGLPHSAVPEHLPLSTIRVIPIFFQSLSLPEPRLNVPKLTLALYLSIYGLLAFYWALKGGVPVSILPHRALLLPPRGFVTTVPNSPQEDESTRLVRAPVLLDSPFPPRE